MLTRQAVVKEAARVLGLNPSYARGYIQVAESGKPLNLQQSVAALRDSKRYILS